LPAGAGAAALTCGDHALAIAEVEVTAKAVAQATATALSFVWAQCDVDERGYACAAAGTWISETAHAVAQSYAELWAEAVACDTCHVSIEVAVSSISTILVKAATDAHAEVCGSMPPLPHDLICYICSLMLQSLAFATAIESPFSLRDMVPPIPALQCVGGYNLT
jgi:hypothetical protein